MREISQAEMVEFEKKKIKVKSSSSKTSSKGGSGSAKLAKQSKQNPSNAKPTVKPSNIYTTDASKNAVISAARKTAALVGQSDKVTASTLGFTSAAQAAKSTSSGKSSSTNSSTKVTGSSASVIPSGANLLDTAQGLMAGAKDFAGDTASSIIDVASSAMNPLATMSKMVNTGREALNLSRGTTIPQGKSGSATTTSLPAMIDSGPKGPNVGQQTSTTKGGNMSDSTKKYIGGAVIIGIAGAYLLALKRSRGQYPRWY